MFGTRLARLMVGIVCAAVVSPAPAIAAQHVKSLPKPPVVAHPDVAPSVPGNITGSSLKISSSLGSVIPGATGTNAVTFGSFRDGDIIVVLDPAGLTGHAGMFDSRYYDSIYSYALWSANTSPVNGVQREQGVKYRANDEAFGLRVSGGTYYRATARNFAARQVGKPYNILGAKNDLNSFYCSKVAWTSWRYAMGVDLDADGGYWVWPVDLINSSRTILFGYWG